MAELGKPHGLWHETRDQTGQATVNGRTPCVLVQFLEEAVKLLATKSILVTGGTGSFGQAFTKRILSNHLEIERLVIFSRDELKQFEMGQKFPQKEFPAIRYFIGDIRDQSRLRRALEGIDIVVHAAALKQVPAAEYNPVRMHQDQRVWRSEFDRSLSRHQRFSRSRAINRQGGSSNQSLWRNQAMLRQIICGG
jgi:NAD(P)-dependent dehydrogenase (short-subunit alcohol dehydrogenase family)